ncbi:hypothetical protein A6R68_13691, partial [Neotoma lepida]
MLAINIGKRQKAFGEDDYEPVATMGDEDWEAEILKPHVSSYVPVFEKVVNMTKIKGHSVVVAFLVLENQQQVIQVMATLTKAEVEVDEANSWKSEAEGGESIDIQGPKVTYIPPPPPEDEDSIFAHYQTGINFDKYDTILVEVSGHDAPPAILTFEEANLCQTLNNNIAKAGYTKLTPVQKYSIPIVLAGRDLMACAQTGTCVRAVVIYGGTQFGHSIRQIMQGCNILCATPGRLMDIIGKEKIGLKQVKYLVLDEADRMLDMGFGPEMKNDREQREREQALGDFRCGKCPVLVATSVAARGLDIENVQHVINFDLPSTIDEYVHRIGRTGRCGNTGRAISFFDTESDNHLAQPLVKVLSDAQQDVPAWLEEIAFSTYVPPGFNNSTRGSVFASVDTRK